MKPRLPVLQKIRRSLQRRLEVRLAQTIILSPEAKPEKLHRDSLVLVLIARICATTPADMSQRLYAAETALTSAMLLATDLRQQNLINDADWPKVKAGLKEASSGMHEAWEAHKAHPEAALDAVEAVLAELKRQLLVMQQLRHVNPAPGSWLYSFFRFVCSPKTFKRVYEPIFADMWDEYYKALNSCDKWKARWIIARTTMQLLTTICLSLGFSLIDKVIKMWKIGG